MINFIILEDFHYLPAEVQKSFSFLLKAFHESSKLCFIIVGVWREKNRLIYYNGDLTNRVSSIDVDIWSEDQLLQVIHAGEALLNIEFDKQTADSLVKNSSDAVALVQESCYRICESENIVETQKHSKIVGKGVDTRDIIKSIVDDQAGRYMAFITNFSEGFQQTDLEMYKWLTYAVLSCNNDVLEAGVRRSQISSLIKDKHPEGSKLNEGNITQALQNAASLQVQKGIRPIIFDYDQTTRVLAVVDRSFLIWLNYQDKRSLIEELGI